MGVSRGLGGGGGKKKKGSGLAAQRIQQQKAKAATMINPFDAIGNKKAKFTVLNKRAKGQVRNVGKARQLAIERRKKTLLVEYKASKKDNVFRDRRFGEDDPSLSLEEKMLIRFQKERQKRARKSAAGRFNLENDDDDDEDDEHGGLLLTHKGRAIGEDDYKDQDLASSDDEDNFGLGKEIVKELHFGGGGAAGRKRPFAGGEDGEEGESNVKKTRAEMMEEIIAKSKLHKAVKAKQKDAQEATLSKLDDAFKDLVGDLQFRDKWAPKDKEKEAREAKVISSLEAAAAYKKSQSEKKGGPLLLDDDDSNYDAMMASMREERFAAKARDRTKTDEEIAKEEKEKLEKLEEARIARMKGELEGEIEEEEDGEEKQGEEEEEEDSDDDDDDDAPANVLEDLEKIWEDDDSEGSSSGSSGSEEDDDDSDDESGSEEEKEDDDDDSGSEVDDEEKLKMTQALLAAAAEAKKLKEKKEKKKKDKKNKEETEVEAAVGRPIGKIARQKAAVQAELAQVQGGTKGINPEMPYVLDCPTTMEHFVEMMKEYAKGPQDAREMISRIRKYHAIRSGGNREQVHNFYDVLMRRLIRLGDHMGSGSVDRRTELDAVAEALMEMTKDMANVAAGLWGRMLGALHNRLAKALRDHELGQGGCTWPSPGSFLLLRLLVQLFPATDFRHPVVTPALLLIGQALAQCPVVSSMDMEAGLFCATLALQYTEGASRLVPEAVIFLLSTLWVLGGGEEDKPLPLPTFAPAFASKLKTGFEAWIGGKGDVEVGPILLKKRSRGEEEGEGDDENDDVYMASFAGQVLTTVCYLIKRAGPKQWGESAAAPEILERFALALGRLGKKGKKGGLRGKELITSTKKMIQEVVAQAKKTRTPLMWRRKEVQSIKSLAPRIIDNFVVRKDEGMEREAAKMKQLARQVKREKKGAMRELRRDAAFLDAEKVKGQREKEMERKKVVRENTNWLQEQQATINQQVRKSKGELLRGGGSGIKKGMLR